MTTRTDTSAEESTLVLQRLRVNDSWQGSLRQQGVIGEEASLRTFKGNQSRWIESNTAEALFSEVTAGLKLTGTARPNRRIAVLSLFNACFESFYSCPEGDACGVLWRTATNTEKQTRYTSRAFSEAARGYAVEHLQEHGYIRFFRGHADPRSLLPGRVSLVLPTAKLRAVYEAVLAEPFHVFQAAGVDRELILLEDKGGRLIDYEDNQQTCTQRDLLQRMNSVNHSFYWSYEAREWETEDSDTETIHPWSLTLKRHFKHGHFDCYGRIHCGAQGLHRKYRRRLQVNYDDTVELDYKHMLPTLLYAEAGVASHEGVAWAPAGDAYSLDGWPRPVVKKALLIALNASSRASAVKALGADSQFQSLCGDRPGGPASLLDGLESKHRRILDYFYSEAWLQLSYVESSLILSVLAQCAARGIPVLPIHDSIICREQDRDAVLAWMVSGFRGAYGILPRITETRSETEEATEVDLGSLAA